MGPKDQRRNRVLFPQSLRLSPGFLVSTRSSTAAANAAGKCLAGEGAVVEIPA